MFLSISEGGTISLVGVFDWILKTFHLGGTNAWYWVLSITAALLCMVIPYLLGSVNPAILLSRKYGVGDIRKLGDGNPGSMNMLVVYGGRAWLLTFLSEVGLSLAACLTGLLLWGSWGVALAGFFVVFGHMFPAFHKFNGGRGLCVMMTAVLVISPVSFVILSVVLIVVTIGLRMLSFGTLTTALLCPIILNSIHLGLFKFADISPVTTLLTAGFVVFAHRENIKRIVAGKEPKIDVKWLWARLRGKV